MGSKLARCCSVLFIVFLVLFSRAPTANPRKLALTKPAAALNDDSSGDKLASLRSRRRRTPPPPQYTVRPNPSPRGGSSGYGEADLP